MALADRMWGRFRSIHCLKKLVTTSSPLQSGGEVRCESHRLDTPFDGGFGIRESKQRGFHRVVQCVDTPRVTPQDPWADSIDTRAGRFGQHWQIGGRQRTGLAKPDQTGVGLDRDDGVVEFYLRLSRAGAAQHLVIQRPAID